MLACCPDHGQAHSRTANLLLGREGRAAAAAVAAAVAAGFADDGPSHVHLPTTVLRCGPVCSTVVAGGGYGRQDPGWWLSWEAGFDAAKLRQEEMPGAAKASRQGPGDIQEMCITPCGMGPST